jgi:L-lactate utilization protein LutC
VRARGLRRISIEPVLLERIDLSASDVAISTESDPSIQLGVTSAVCGLADTGSIVVTEHLPHRRPGSLVPEIHVAILRESDLLPTLSDALNLPEVQESAAAVVITGPSRTGDIEMTHTIGVHGPRELHVLLVQ